MTYLERTECLDRLHQLISRRSTGTPKELATKLGVSVSTLYSLISDARTLGAKVQYNNKKMSYEYICKTEFYPFFCSLE